MGVDYHKRFSVATQMEYSDLRGLQLRSCYQLGIQGYLRVGETLSLLIEEITQTIQRMVEENPQAKLLTTTTQPS